MAKKKGRRKPAAPKRLTAADAQAALEQDARKREAACDAAVMAACKTWRCGLMPVVTIAGGQIATEVRIVAQRSAETSI